VKRAGDEIREYGLPVDAAPITFVFTGTGNVAQGAQSIFELLPHKYITPAELANLHLQPKNPHIVYGCVIEAKDMVERIVAPGETQRPFDKKEYYADPTLYRPIFAERIAPFTSVLVNW
jgi:alpha-aminoadipic semialdehyde synthase